VNARSGSVQRCFVHKVCSHHGPMTNKPSVTRVPFALTHVTKVSRRMKPVLDVGVTCVTQVSRSLGPSPPGVPVGDGNRVWVVGTGVSEALEVWELCLE
jgi:hypothetical protein